MFYFYYSAHTLFSFPNNIFLTKHLYSNTSLNSCKGKYFSIFFILFFVRVMAFYPVVRNAEKLAYVLLAPIRI